MIFKISWRHGQHEVCKFANLAVERALQAALGIGRGFLRFYGIGEYALNNEADVQAPDDFTNETNKVVHLGQRKRVIRRDF